MDREFYLDVVENDIENYQKNYQKKQQRFEEALAFTVAACDKKGMVTDRDVEYAVEQADRFLAELGKTK